MEKDDPLKLALELCSSTVLPKSQCSDVELLRLALALTQNQYSADTIKLFEQMKSDIVKANQHLLELKLGSVAFINMVRKLADQLRLASPPTPPVSHGASALDSSSLSSPLLTLSPLTVAPGVTPALLRDSEEPSRRVTDAGAPSGIGIIPPESPAVTAGLQDTPDKIICRECNKPFSMITSAHLRHHNLTPEQYKDKHGIPRHKKLACDNLLEQRRNKMEDLKLWERSPLMKAQTAAADAEPAMPTADGNTIKIRRSKGSTAAERTESD